MTENIDSKNRFVQANYYSKKMKAKQDKKVHKKYEREKKKKESANYTSDHLGYIFVYILFLLMFFITSIIFSINKFKDLIDLNNWFIFLNSIFYFNSEIREKKSSTYISAWITFIYFNYPFNYFIIRYAYIIFIEISQNITIVVIFFLLTLLFIIFYIPIIYFSLILIPLIRETKNYSKTYINYNYKIINIIIFRIIPLIKKYDLRRDYKYFIKEIKKKSESIKDDADKEYIIKLSKNYYFDFDTTSDGDIRIKINETHKFKDEQKRIPFIGQLSKFSTLIELSINNNKLINFDAFGEMKNLRYLNLANNEIIEIENMHKFPNLIDLDLTYNMLKEIKNLESLKDLKSLSLSNNLLEKVENLKKLYNLQQLNLSSNLLSEIPNFNENNDLRELNLSKNKITEMKNLNVLKRLKILDLSNNEIKEIKNLENNYQLITIILSNNSISKIQNLDHLNELFKIDLSYNLITELEGLGLSSLREWHLNNNPLKSNDLIALNYSPHMFIKYNLEKKSQLTETKKIKEKKSKKGLQIKNNKFELEFALSFAGEDREIAEAIAKLLDSKSVKVFYDKFEEADLLGKNLSTYFQDVYGPKAKYFIPLISKDYAIKDWTSYELSIARDEAKKRKEEFILPIKLDDTKVLGIHDDIGYINYKKHGLEKTVDLLIEKLKKSIKK